MSRLMIATLALSLTPGLAAAETVSGTVTYRERMLLPQGAALEVVLEDVSRADAPAVEIGSFAARDPGTPPFSFSIDYDPATIEPANRYGLRARVTAGDRLMMTTDQAYPVLTQGAGTTADMVLKMAAKSPAATPDAALVNTYWKIVTLKGEAVPPAEGSREAHVVLREDQGLRYSATVGCNMVGGALTLEGETIAFLPGPMTLMACPPPLDVQEHRLVEVLGAAARWRIEGERMWLLDGAGSELAEFRAVYF